MKKPFYKHWLFWVAVVVLGSIVGQIAARNEPADQASPAATQEVQGTAAPAADTPASEPTDGNPSVSWESAIEQIAQSDTDSAQKADAVEVLAKAYSPSPEELTDFESQVVEEYNAGNYLAHIEDAEYMLTNLFKAVVVEGKHTDGEPIKDFASAFYQNTKNTFLGVETAGSDNVKESESQMDKALAEIK
ncbi:MULTISPECIES: hypothetical protein [unclassified Paenibacillus]|uniref:hypothetical protein n=1 Tax=unclassified Paenibacillus TaxID=185978 RepID=UPI002405F57F|nr:MULTISPECIES: hypothetical protein [unclassified Paenibacillus]MDF9840264.1 hypothetical protein [Paenibacillus sp. PastF-2]MDF9846846.1 hypothetical protein [Paenibacillus sp. PastM-2]MDF9853418.1 hypothetical protein [Paenibacillus sp. PastF-1]MDH6479095.1 hypothetical protein [Paenibacillus sp. PastH-2]MDH6506826.1 hypothetical protein [Paenibacillus sp. PastM-3]